MTMLGGDRPFMWKHKWFEEEQKNFNFFFSVLNATTISSFTNLIK